MSKEADVNCDGDSSSVDECDNNKSFVKKVTSHVSGLIPETINQWFRTKLRQRDDFEEEDETYELPPTKRIKKSSNDNLFDMNIVGTPLHGQEHNPFSTDTFREPVPGPSNINARKLVLAASNHYNQNRTDQTNGGDSDSGESTSGYSSMPRIGSKELVSDIPGQSNQQPDNNNSTVTTQHKSIFNTSIPHERSLFGESLTSPNNINSSLSSRRPSFNASTFGAPNFMDKTLSTRRIYDSPFYHGRITYGGASAYNTTLLHTAPRSPSIQPKLINENKSAALSKTAKRILDTLEQYTSPVQDVRRIPTTGRRGLSRPDGLIGKYMSANPYGVRDVPKAPCIKELQVPTMTDLLKMKERLQDSTSSVRDLANTSSSTLNHESYSIKSNEDDKQATGKNRNKIKTKVSFVRQKPCGFTSEPAPVNLPDVQLPISTLPTFNFSIPLNKPVTTSACKSESESKKLSEKSSSDKKHSNLLSKSTVPSITSATAAIPSINFEYPEVKTTTQPISPFCKNSTNVISIPSFDKPEKLDTKQTALGTMKNSSGQMEYRFSKPLVISENKFKSLQAINNFKFSMPLIKKVCNGVTEISKSTESTNLTESANLPKTGFGDVFKMGSDKWECDVCMVRNPSTSNACVSCTSPKPSAKPVVNGSGKPAQVTSISSWGDKFKAPTNSWECSMCMVQNDSGKTKCIACENPKSASEKAAMNSSKATSLEGFKKKENEWECGSCMVRNSDSKLKCVCCEAAKPGAKTLPASSKPISISSSWGDKFKVPPSTWECTMCLVRNEVLKEKCVACENPRPAGIAAPKGIADGFKKEGEWECTSCMVKNPSNKLKCVCCEAQKPSTKPMPTAQVSEVPKFSFGIENGLINGHGFMFGIPADKNNAKEIASVVVDAGASAETKKTETDATPAQFSFGMKPPNGAKPFPTASLLPVVEAAKPESKTPSTIPSFSFGVPTATRKRSLNDDDTSISETPKKIEAQAVKNINSMNGTITSEPPKFTFGTNATATPISKAPSFMFSAPKATESSAKPILEQNSVKPFSFGSSASTNNDAKTMFGSSTLTPSTTLNLQSKPIATTVDATATASTSAPIFKFGSVTSPSSTAKSATSMFSAGNNSTNEPVPTFNFAAPKLPEKPAESTTTPSFTFNSPTASVKSPPAFGTGASSTSTNFNAPLAPSIFGNSNNNASSIFGASAPSTNTTNNIFGNSAAPTPVASFGGAASNHTAGGSLFGAAKSQPTFGSSTPAPAFGATATTAPAAGGSTFPSANMLVFNFKGANESTEPGKTAFNFGATNNAAPSANGGFNFTAGSNPTVPNFNASVKPSFNFTGGAPTSFTSQVSDTNPPAGRVIRRAIRRTHR